MTMEQEEQFREVISRINEFRLENDALMEQIKNSFNVMLPQFDSIIPKAILEYTKINSLQIEVIKNSFNIQSPMFEFIKAANLSISNIANHSILSGIAKQAITASDLWKQQIISLGSLSETIKASQLAFQSKFAKISELTLLAQRSMLSTQFAEIGNAVNLSDTLREIFTNVQHDFTKSYSLLFKSFELEADRVISLPPAASLLPPVEFYTGARVLRLITNPQDIEYSEEKSVIDELTNQTADIVPKLLQSLEPDLIKLWQGANIALKSNKPDSVRHFIISLRELLTHVIHKLAPDTKIQEWSNSSEHYYNNKPTRRARLLYICREVNFKPFDNFLNKDIESVLACFELFQQGTHEIDSLLNQIQLDAIKLRTESAIRFLIDIGIKTGKS